MSGWLIRVETQRLGGGEEMREIYAVNEPNPILALEIVAKQLDTSPDQGVHTWIPISDDFLEVFNVPIGECRHVIAVA